MGRPRIVIHSTPVAAHGSYYRQTRLVHSKCHAVSGAPLYILYAPETFGMTPLDISVGMFELCIWPVWHVSVFSMDKEFKNDFMLSDRWNSDEPMFVFLRSRVCPRSGALRWSLWCMWSRIRAQFLMGHSPAACWTSWPLSWSDTSCSTLLWSSLSVRQLTLTCGTLVWHNMVKDFIYGF